MRQEDKHMIHLKFLKFTLPRLYLNDLMGQTLKSHTTSNTKVCAMAFRFFPYEKQMVDSWTNNAAGTISNELRIM